MIDVIFWSGFCFGVAITAGAVEIFWIIFNIIALLKKKIVKAEPEKERKVNNGQDGRR